MQNLGRIAQRIQDSLEEKDTVREIAIKSSRAIIRMSSGVVHGMHKGQNGEMLLAEAIDEAHRLKSVLSEHVDIWHSGIVQDALQEVAEAAILTSIVNGQELPDPEQLGMPGTAYLMGMADTIGELRRFSLEALRRGETTVAEKYLDIMEELFLVIMRFDYPDALVSIRRKQDIARSVLEKTRGDVSIAVSGERLRERLSDLEKRL
ncbi:MAG: translin family protein [Methanomassiliicoccus sp.]|nr:MAG: translin family protein [Methanomassiliicoccus sp.]